MLAAASPVDPNPNDRCAQCGHYYRLHDDGQCYGGTGDPPRRCRCTEFVPSIEKH